MQLHFTKMHGCGNDYIYLDCRETGLPAEIAVWSQKLSRRHFFHWGGRHYLHLPAADGGRRRHHADVQRGWLRGQNVRQRGALCGAVFVHARRAEGCDRDRHPNGGP